MKIAAAQAYCILDTVGSAILTKSGDISVVYLMELPEAYSLDTADLEQRHNEFFRAFQYVRNGFIHKQDIFLRRKFKSDYVIEGDTYIQKAERRYFEGREYLHHFCILSFTLSSLSSLEKAYQANPLDYREKLTKADKDRLSDYITEYILSETAEEDADESYTDKAVSDFAEKFPQLFESGIKTNGRPVPVFSRKTDGFVKQEESFSSRFGYLKRS